MKPIIEVNNIAKKFFIKERVASYQNLRDNLFSVFKNKLESKEFFALKDISFKVEAGESIAIIGRNGAGKSTLLKILSRITPPSSGKIISRGRIASLLEVGTGFHPELTGRENIFFNGSILGLKKKEIVSRFDEIVDFSGVEKFLDTPLKHYSSGMQLRLAFAVAAHLDPEILIIDEVLAVGDAEFQKKCLNKMENVKNAGRTLLFVSHNLTAVQSICRSAILLDKGEIKSIGTSEEIIREYLGGFSENKMINEDSFLNLSDSLILRQFTFQPGIVNSGDGVDFLLEFSSTKNTTLYSLVILIYNSFEYRVGIVDLRNKDLSYKFKDSITIQGRIHSLPLVEGEYKIGLFLQTDEVSSNFFNLVSLAVSATLNNKGITPYPAEVRGFIEFSHEVSIL